MSETFITKPLFGGRLKADEYYLKVRGIIDACRKSNQPLSAIASILNAAGLQTPRNLDWNRVRVFAFIRNTNI